MKYDPNEHNRRSIRLKNYDYTKAGFYFITINCQHRAKLFGEIKDRQMIRNTAGDMIFSWYSKLESKFPDVKCHEIIVMPDHIHFVIETQGRLRNTISRQETGTYHIDEHGETVLHTTCEGVSLSRIIQWFKTMTTNGYIKGVKIAGWTRFYKRLWQRNYYERIIRDEQALVRITQYIIDNPTHRKG